MVKRNRPPQSTVLMGQHSSQVEPIGDYETVEPATSSSKRDSHGKKKSKRKAKSRNKVSENSADLDEESARVLLQLREDVGDNAQLTPTYDETIAPSAPQKSASSPGSPLISNGVESEMAEAPSLPSDFQRDEQRRRKKQKKKRNRYEFETSQRNGDDSQATKHDTTERPSKQARRHTSISTPKIQLNLTQSSFKSLDDIPTDDETIATYFQEYEKTFTNPISPNPTPAGALESKSQPHQQAGTIDSEGSSSPVQSVYQLPCRSPTSSGRHEKERSNHKTRSGIVLETSDSDQEQTNGTGQHTFTAHHEASDEGFETEQYGSAKFSDDPEDCDFPIDPDLIQDSPILSPTEEVVRASSDKDVCQQPSKEGRSKRVSSSSRKRKEDQTPCRVNRFDLPCTTSEDPARGKLHAALPTNESSRESSPPNGTLSNVSSVGTERSAQPTTRRQRDKTPPPLAKACKPRGNKRQQGGQKGKHYDPPLKEIAHKGGMFTDSETLKLDSFRDSYCQQNEMTPWQFNELVQSAVRDNPNATHLWNEVHEITPYRTRMSTMRFCRRRYHNFSARGTWTPSEDESLRQAVAEKGKSWIAVGAMINRFPEDCRDRYRNYHVNSEHRNREHWTEGEVRNLCSAVYACMRMMSEERKRARQDKFYGRDVPESEPESDEEVQESKLINWQAVSDRMGPAGGGRSRLQCSFKWGKMKVADRDRYLKEVKAAARAKPTTRKNKIRQEKGSWRLGQALKKLRNMKPGDKYDFLQALSTCGAVEEKNIPYRLLGDEAFRSRWTTVERKAAWQKLKGEVPGAERMDYRDVVNRLLTQLMAESMDQLEERWDLQVHGDVNLAKKKRRRLTEDEKKERERLRQEEQERKMNIKSLQFVHPSDEDEEDDRAEPTDQPTDAEVIEGSVQEMEAVAGSSAAASDDAHGGFSGEHAGTDVDASAAGSDVEDSVEDSAGDDGLFIDSTRTDGDELASQVELLRDA